jgi:N-acylneuraminate cytidylyltransferase
LDINKIDTFIIDFDGVLTNNQVLVDGEGNEQVFCSRSDGLAFDVLRKLKKNVFIFSTEKNKVVSARAKKLKVKVIQGLGNKEKSLKSLSIAENINLDNSLYVGNDVNDYFAMSMCGYSACPHDSHGKIKSIAKIHLLSDGGSGVIRELLEDIFSLNFLEILYNKDN